MSTLSAVLTVAAVLAVSLPAAYWQIRRARAEESTRDRIIRESLERPDPRWGTDVAVQDACELIWSMPEFDPDLDAGCDRLRDAIDEHRKEDTP